MGALGGCPSAGAGRAGPGRGLRSPPRCEGGRLDGVHQPPRERGQEESGTLCTRTSATVPLKRLRMCGGADARLRRSGAGAGLLGALAWMVRRPYAPSTTPWPLAAPRVGMAACLPTASRRDVERRVSSCRRRPWWRRRPKTGWMLRRGDSTGSVQTRQSPAASALGLLPGQTRPATCPLSSGRLLQRAVREAGKRLAELGCLGMMDGVVRRGLGGFWALFPPPIHG